jgi:hypothetical protein
MAQQPMPQWERQLRKIGMNLVDGIRNIFGSSTAVAYRPPEPEPKREDGLHHGDHAHTSTPPTPGDRLPPRERRGRD